MSNKVIEQLVKGMIEIGCLKISPNEPFTYASGLKGPIYCDNRMILSHPDLRKMVAKEFSKIIDSKKLVFDHIAGVATAGIPHAAFLSEEVDRSMVYIRSKPKGHGKGKMVEGDAKEGQTLLLVEDLINQGSSISKVIQGVRERGFVVDNALCIVDYQMKNASKLLNSLEVEHFALINFLNLTDMLCTSGIIDVGERALLESWHSDPENWMI